MSTTKFAGRVIWADISRFVFSCRQDDLAHLRIGSLVSAKVEELEAVASITNIVWSTDQLAQQFVMAREFSDGILGDQIWRRIGGPAINCVIVGYKRGNQISHALPDRTVLSLSEICLLDHDEIQKFTLHAFSYLGKIISNVDRMIRADVVANHIDMVANILDEDCRQNWIVGAKRSVTQAMRQDPDEAIRFIQIMSNRRTE